MKEQFRRGDLTGRLGGQEFGVFLPAASRADAARIAERIRRSFEEAAFGTGAGQIRMTVSISAAALPPGGSTMAAYSSADRALYDAKLSGRNRVSVAQEGRQ